MVVWLSDREDMRAYSDQSSSTKIATIDLVCEATAINYESIVAQSRFERGQLAEVRLTPIEGRRDAPCSSRYSTAGTARAGLRILELGGWPSSAPS